MKRRKITQNYCIDCSKEICIKAKRCRHCRILGNLNPSKRPEVREKQKITRLKRKEELGYLNSPETRLKLSAALTGKKHSKEWKLNMREKTKGNKNGMWGRHYSKEEREFIGKRTKEEMNKPEAKKRFMIWRKNFIFPVKDTSIELKIQKYLTELKIEFLIHKYMDIEHGYQCDIFISSINLVIEADGDYWHGNPNKYPNPSEFQQIQIEEDKIRTKELQDKGYRVLRIWGKEIKNITVNDLKNKLSEGEFHGTLL